MNAYIILVKFWVEELFENEPACDVYIVGTKGIASLLLFEVKESNIPM
jgi:hypothetical protein